MIDLELKNKLKDYLNEREIEVLEKVYKRIEFEDYFFRTKSDVKWFYPLKILDYFNYRNAPGSILADQEGYFTIPEWNVLPYLERVSQQLNISGNEKYIYELLEIIKSVTEYHIKNDKILDNYRTWWYFVKILLNIPNEKIPLDIIELIPIWLDSKFDLVLQGSEIATKLLPKFLPDAPTAEDIQKAEKIIESITTIRTFPLKWEKVKLIGKKEEAKLVVDPYWLKEAFDKYSAIIGEKCTSKVIEDLAKKIRTLLKRKKSEVSFDVDNKTYLLVLEEDNSNYVVKILSVEKKSPANISEEIFTEKESDGVLVKKLLIDKCDKEIFVNKVYQDLTKEELFQKAEPNTLKRKIQNLYRNLYDYGTYKSFYEESEYLIRESLELFTFILKRILFTKAKNDVNATKLILRDFLKDNYLYFPKMAIYVIGQNIDNYSELFWELLDSDTGDFIMESIYFSDELKHLLQNLKNLSDEQKKKLRDKIEEGPKHYIPKEDTERYIAIWKQERYQALSFDPYFKKLYEEIKEITKVDAELKPVIGKVETGWGPGPSPLTKEELLRMPNKELAKFLSTFKTKDFWRGPTVGGLSDMLKGAVQERPEKFINELSPFLNTGYLYIYDILWGIRDAWNEKKMIDWGKLFDFIKQYINRDEFWQDKFKMADDDWNANHTWVLGMIGELIQVGTKDDNWAFGENHLLAAQEIIFHIIDNLKIKEEKEISDPVTHALNSPFGKTITALIYLALRIARLEDKKGEKREVRWSDELKNKYEKVLKDEVIEAYTLLGQYMPNLYYLDKPWVEQKIKDFESIKEEQYWSAFMIGYLFGSRLYENLYKLMREHYLKAISYLFKEEHAEERLIQHIAIGYLRGIEDLSEKSLFGMLLKKWNPSQIIELIRFFWMQSDYLVKSIDKGVPVPSSDENEKLKNKIIEFWKWLYEKYKDKESLNGDDKKILSAVAKLAVFLPKIDNENFKWLMLSAPYVHLDFNSPFFIEYLDEIKDKGDRVESGKYVGRIFLKMLDAFTPDYDQKHLKSIVEYLSKVKDEETMDSANEICNIYGRRGLEFLREICEKNKYVKTDG